MDRGIGELVKKEDNGIYFKLNDIYDVPLDSWKVNNRIIFNQKSDHMCVGNFVTCSRIDRYLNLLKVQGVMWRREWCLFLEASLNDQV